MEIPEIKQQATTHQVPDRHGLEADIKIGGERVGKPNYSEYGSELEGFGYLESIFEI